MKLRHCRTWLPLVCAVAALAAGGAAEQPTAKRVDHADVYHGVRVADPYRWLEDMNGSETKAWASAQDRYARAYAAAHPRWADTRRLIARISNSERYGSATTAGGRLFYQRYRSPAARPAILVREPSGQTRALIEETDLPAGYELRSYTVSPDGGKLAYQIAKPGTRWNRLKIRDLATGKDLPETLTGLHSGYSSVTWSPDGRLLFYGRLQPPKPGGEFKEALKHLGVYSHRPGREQSADALVHREPDHDAWYFGHSATEDGRWLILVGRNGERRKALSLDLKEPGQARTLFETKDMLGFLGAVGDDLLFQTHEDAPRGRVVAVPAAQPERAHWRAVIAESEDTLVSVSLAAGRIWAVYREDALPMAKAFFPDGRLDYRVALPKIALLGGFSGRMDAKRAIYRLTDLADPGSIYRIDVATGKSEPLVRSDLPYALDDYQTRQVFYPSKDGTRVPMLLVHRREVKPGPDTPLFMYGYGAGNWAAFPWFQPHMVAWLEMGGVYAMPNIRGGGEYGREWHEAGIHFNKQNAIDDFIAAGRWLVDQGLASRKRLVGDGGSASGPLVGAALVQAPELFAACLVEWPVTDMLRFDQFPGGPFWRWSNGSPANRKDFENLRRWSPYHNVREETCYPAVMTIVGERDESTVPAHGYKLQAALQHAQGCGKPALLRIVPKGGHYQYGVNREDTLDTMADALAFLMRALDWEPAPKAAAGAP